MYFLNLWDNPRLQAVPYGGWGEPGNEFDEDQWKASPI